MRRRKWMHPLEALKTLELRDIKELTADDVKRAYRKLAMKHHPDKGGDAEKFKFYKGPPRKCPNCHSRIWNRSRSQNEEIEIFQYRIQESCRK